MSIAPLGALVETEAFQPLNEIEPEFLPPPTSATGYGVSPWLTGVPVLDVSCVKNAVGLVRLPKVANWPLPAGPLSHLPWNSWAAAVPPKCFQKASLPWM